VRGGLEEPLVSLDAAVREDLIAGKYAFIDAGCRSGGSIRHCELRFGGPGLGLDLSEDGLAEAREAGYAAARCDLRTVDLPKGCVRYASMMDFLEHLPDERTAVGVLRKLGSASRDFLFIRHPSFDDVEYLKGFGLKLGWTDWTGHPNMWSTDDFRRVFEAAGWSDYLIRPDMEIRDSSHPGIVPLDAPRDVYEYDEAAHGPKASVAFDRPLFGKFDIFVRLNPQLGDAEWERITNMDGWRAVWVSGTW
jgi:hypothetical protein